MKILKRLTAICLCLSILSFFIIPVRAENETSLSKAERFAIGVGFLEKEEYNSQKEVTRAEFAGILVRAMQLVDLDYEKEQWKSNALGADTTTTEQTVAENIFTDVDASHPYYYEIQLAKQYGIMEGISSIQFAPEYGITVCESVKVLLSVMGYKVQADAYGGYPEGYTNLAQTTGLLKNVKGSITDVITNHDVAQIIYNALDVELLECDFSTNTYEFSDETFMTGILKYGKVKGTVTDNGYTSIDGNSTIGHNKLTVNDITVTLKDSYASDYIGRQVEMYYSTDDEDENFMLHIELDNEDVITFDAADFASFSNGVISYYENERKISKTLDKNVNLIVNNQMYTSFDEETLKFGDGDITLVPDKNGKYTLIIANKYEYAVVSSVNASEEYIYSKLKGEDVSTKYHLPSDDETVNIRDVSGSPKTSSDISVGDVLNIRQSDNFVDVIISNETVSGFKVTEKSSDEKQIYISDGTNGYTTSMVYERLSNKPEINVQQIYTLYLNMFGEVIWVSDGSLLSDDRTGVLTMAKYFEDEMESKQRLVKIFTDEGILDKFYATEKIRINGVKKKYEKAVEILNNAIGSVVLFKTSEEDIITEITIANEYGNEEKIGWYKIAPTKEYTYGAQGGDFDNTFYVAGGSTLVYTAPISTADYNKEDNFSVGTAGFTDNGKYTIEAYAKDPSSVVADAVILRQAAKSGGKTKEGEAFFIERIVNTVNEDDEPILMFKGYTFAFQGRKATAYAELPVAEDAIMVSFGGVGTEIPADGDINEVGPRTYRELSAGDMIYYNLNIRGEIDTIRIGYDYSTGKAFNCGRGDDFYAPENAGRRAVAVNSTWVGGAVSKCGDGVRISIKDKPEDVNYNDFDSVQKTLKAFRLTNTNAILVAEPNRSGFYVRKGNIDDIITYEDTGEYDNVLVMTYWSSGQYGTVIYK